jgi:hypothetical protein
MLIGANMNRRIDLNWEAMAAAFIQWLHREMVNGAGDEPTRRLLDEVLFYRVFRGTDGHAIPTFNGDSCPREIDQFLVRKLLFRSLVWRLAAADSLSSAR